MPYDPQYLKSYYDKYGRKEWYRLAKDAEAQVSFFLHQHYLLEFVRKGDRVLEIGPGPGRFTIELANLGASVVALDISAEQLRLNQEQLTAEGLANAVEAWVEGDVTDLSRYQDAEFDAVVCYGGPLSYVFEQADKAVEEMLRVVKPGGYVLLSVMSLLGTTRRFLSSVVELSFQQGLDQVDRVTRSGDLVGPVAQGHYCHMYRWSELEAMLKRHACGIAAASASGFLVLQDPEVVRLIQTRRAHWETLLEWELLYCREPGAIDGGTHIIAVAQRHKS